VQSLTAEIKMKNLTLKKSIYIFLCSLLGVLLFLTLHRIVVFIALVFFNPGPEGVYFGMSYLQFLALDYFTLLLVMLLGAWYGIWIGTYWFEQVYQEGAHGGFVSHLANFWFPTQKVRVLRSRLESVSSKLENSAWELEDLAKTLPKTPVVKSVVKKRTVRKKTISKV
jgi:hypothetical protein